MPCVVDHEVDSQICELFERISREQNGRLDILVNNAYKAVNVKLLKRIKFFYFRIFKIFKYKIKDNHGCKFSKILGNKTSTFIYVLFYFEWMYIINLFYSNSY